jgi:hypothetical protein
MQLCAAAQRRKNYLYGHQGILLSEKSEVEAMDMLLFL